MPCERCQSKQVLCQYTTTSSKSKGELRQELEVMRKELEVKRAELSSAQQVIKTLLNHVGGSQALAQLADGHSAETIVASLVGADVPTADQSPATIPPQRLPLGWPLDDQSSQLDSEAAAQITLLPVDQQGGGDSPRSWHWFESNYQLESTQETADGPTVPRTLSQPLASRQDGPNEFISTQQWSQEIMPNPGTWTIVTDDIKLVHHLLALFFCWEYPTFVTLSREHFIADFRGGSNRFCSSILVNAILATGCRFSRAVVFRTSLWAGGTQVIRLLLGIFFFKSLSGFLSSKKISTRFQ